jgi:hypothetical protein
MGLGAAGLEWVGGASGCWRRGGRERLATEKKAGGCHPGDNSAGVVVGLGTSEAQGWLDS